MLQLSVLSSIYLLFFIFTISHADVPKATPSFSSKKELQKSEKLPPCKSCTVLVNSFQEGMKRTEREKHGGGDAAWEEEKLGSYRTSELRLVEIQESLCRDIGRGEDQCHNLAEVHEHDIEEWWLKHQLDNPDLFKWLCIERLAMCCPDNQFGPKCNECSDCNGNGRCKGNGTRKGNGKCVCDQGYKGVSCNDCDDEYYEAFRDETKLLCTPCHVACDDGGCTSAGPKGCRVCRSGWIMDTSRGGCTDIDECFSTKPVCTNDQFCVNNEGSYSCLECDKSCVGCTGDGPDLCDKCADGYELRDGLCTDVSNEKRSQYVTFTRYMTYFGLCVATCIVFQSSTWLAALVGLAVAVYISVSEYWLTTSPESPITPSPKILDQILQQN